MATTRAIGVGVAVLAVVGAGTWRAYSHCQIPCGIYDDDARVATIREHITTIEKSMREIDKLAAAKVPNYNQLVRWVSNKDHHADLISEIVTQYFMMQRIEPADPTDEQAYGQYVKQLTLLHRMLIAAMKSKQTTDTQYTAELRGLLSEFAHAYGDRANKD